MGCRGAKGNKIREEGKGGMKVRKLGEADTELLQAMERESLQGLSRMLARIGQNACKDGYSGRKLETTAMDLAMAASLERRDRKSVV